jgi:hypothetical protein
MLDLNDKAKTDFWVKFGKKMTFDLYERGQFLRNFKNASTGLFL